MTDHLHAWLSTECSLYKRSYALETKLAVCLKIIAKKTSSTKKEGLKDTKRYKQVDRTGRLDLMKRSEVRGRKDSTFAMPSVIRGPTLLRS